MNKHLSNKSKIGYGIGNFVEAGFYNFMTTFLLIYLTSVVMLPAKMAGTITSVAILMEAIGSIFVGYFSDNCHSIYGRRRPFMIISGLAMVIMSCCLFLPINGSDNLKFIYYFVVVTVFWATYAAFYIPYTALGAEMTGDYDERISLRSYARFFGIMGTLICTVSPLMIVGWLVSQGLEKTQAWLAFAIGMNAISAISIFLCWKMTKGQEPTYKEKVASLKEYNILELFKDYFQIIRQKTCMLLLIGRTCFFTSYTLYTASLLYFMKYKLALNDAVTSTVFIVGIIASLIYMPFISKLAIKIGKQQEIAFSVIIAGVGGMVIYTVGMDTLAGIYLYICLFTFAHSSMWQICSAMLYDLTEVDEFVYGRRREGSIVSLASVLGTAAVSIGLWILGLLLELAGYNATLSQQPKNVIDVIEDTFILFPSGLLIIVGVTFLIYPMNRNRFYTLQEILSRKKDNVEYTELLEDVKKLQWRGKIKIKK